MRYPGRNRVREILVIQKQEYVSGILDFKVYNGWNLLV